LAQSGHSRALRLKVAGTKKVERRCDRELRATFRGNFQSRAKPMPQNGLKTQARLAITAKR
jgi:hypothetical protein